MVTETNQENQPEKEESWRVAKEIWKALGERVKTVQRAVHSEVERIGVEAARELLAKTQEIEASGGMMLPDGSRRRTPGGVFFALARELAPMTKEEVRAAWKQRKQWVKEHKQQYEARQAKWKEKRAEQKAERKKDKEGKREETKKPSEEIRVEASEMTVERPRKVIRVLGTKAQSR